MDWAAYFRAFCEKHGEPVQYRNRLIFRDAWSYSAKQYEGPEYRPPDSERERQRIKRDYWTVKRQALYDRWWKMNQELQGLTELQYIRDAPLHHSIVVVGDDGRPSMVSVPVDFDELKQKLESLVEMIRMVDCILTMPDIPDDPTTAEPFIEQFGALAAS